MNIRTLSLLLTLLVTTNVFSQDSIPYIDFENITKSVIKFEADGDFHGAYLAYEKTNKNDSNYIHSLISKSYYMLNDEELDSTKYDAVINMMDEGINYPAPISKLNFYINKSVSYIKTKRYEEALINFDKALLVYPKNDNLYYRKALVYESLDQYDNAVKMYKKAITINPYNPEAHLQLGNLCYKSN